MTDGGSANTFFSEYKVLYNLISKNTVFCHKTHNIISFSYVLLESPNVFFGKQPGTGTIICIHSKTENLFSEKNIFHCA